MDVVWTSLAYLFMLLAFYQVSRKIIRFFRNPTAGCDSCGYSEHCSMKTTKGGK